MVESVKEVRSQLHLHRLANREVLKDREIQVVNARDLERVPSRSRLRPDLSLDILRIRVVCYVSYSTGEIGIGGAVRPCERNCLSIPADRPNRSGCPDNARRVDD